MQRKYFAAFSLMDKEHLRANPFFHSSIILLYADCDDNEQIKLPLRIHSCYGFYSHNLPYKKSFYEEPLAFFTQMQDKLRLRGSYGEWRVEDIHDLTYGLGLTGRLIEQNIIQFRDIQKHIKKSIRAQKKFLSTADNLIDLEENYKNYERTQFLKLVKEGVAPEEAERKTRGRKPLPEFNSFPLQGGAYSCKTAGLDTIEDGYDADSSDVGQKRTLDYLRYLRYGPRSDNVLFMFFRFLTSFIPNRTPDLEELIFHCSSDQWESRGENSKYPFCDWKNIKEGDIFAITAGSWYIDLNGCVQPLMTPDNDCRAIIKNLKTISRICEINLTEDRFKVWHKKINHFLEKMAACTTLAPLHSRSVSANEYLRKLVDSKEFKDGIEGKVPVNLQPLLDAVYQHYNPPKFEEAPQIEEDSDEVNRSWVLA